MEETHEVTGSLSPWGPAHNFHPKPFCMGWAHLQGWEGVLFLRTCPDCWFLCASAWHNSRRAPVKPLSTWELAQSPMWGLDFGLWHSSGSALEAAG